MHSAINHDSNENRSKYGYRKSGSAFSSSGKQRSDTGLGTKRFRDTDMVIIRNKFTKEVVDLEVSAFIY